MSQDITSLEKLDLLEEIGSIVEIVSITGHDFVKRKEGEPNVFGFWLGARTEASQKSEFLATIQEILRERSRAHREFTKQEHQAEIREILNNVGKVLKAYYGFSEFDELVKVVLPVAKPGL